MVGWQKGEMEEKKLICGKITSAARSILLWLCISKKLVKMKQMSSETTASFCEAVSSETSLYFKQFHVSVKPCKVGN